MKFKKTLFTAFAALFFISVALLGMQKSPEKQIMKFEKEFETTMKVLTKNIELENKTKKEPKTSSPGFIKFLEWKTSQLYKKTYNIAKAISEMPGGKELGKKLREELLKKMNDHPLFGKN